MRKFFLRGRGTKVVLAVIATASLWLGAKAAQPSSVPSYDRRPRKVVVGTLVGGYEIYSLELEARLQKVDQYLSGMARQAGDLRPDGSLDLAVFPEYFVGHAGSETIRRAVTLAEVQGPLSALARKYHCYLLAPLVLHESGGTAVYSNASLLFDRQGQLLGMYRKVHPVGGHGSESLEGGTTPGAEFKVFDCDFGRLGVQVCFDMLYEDGWRSLAQQGAEVVALPSASPETVHPSFYALQYHYYVVSATPRDHSAIFNPVGMIEAEASTEGTVLVHQFDLSYEALHWDADLDEGAAVRRKFGDKVGFHYYRDQDMGIFWSNDPQTTIAQMIGSMGISPAELELKRLEAVQSRLRGRPIDPR